MADKPLHNQADANVHFKVGDGECPGYLSSVNSDSENGLVVIQEWWGMNKTICKNADEFADLGFRALVPDLYRGKVAKDSEEAGHFMGGLNWGQAIEDIRGAARFLQEKGCKKVGIVGFCMGGALVIKSSTLVDEFSAGICFYGCPDLSQFDASTVKFPLLCFFGGLDKAAGFSDPATADKLEKLLKDAGKQAEFVRYPNGDHAFMNRDRPEVYNADLASQARAKSGEFLKKIL